MTHPIIDVRSRRTLDDPRLEPGTGFAQLLDPFIAEQHECRRQRVGHRTGGGGLPCGDGLRDGTRAWHAGPRPKPRADRGSGPWVQDVIALADARRAERGR